MCIVYFNNIRRAYERKFQNQIRKSSSQRMMMFNENNIVVIMNLKKNKLNIHNKIKFFSFFLIFFGC